MKLKNYNKVVSQTPDDVKIFVRHSMDILDRIHELLNEKFEGKQKLLADKMGKSEAEVSKWLSGVQNFTLKTLSKLEAAFGEPIISINTNDYANATFVQVKSTTEAAHVRMAVTKEGDLKLEGFVATSVGHNKVSSNNTLA